MGGMVLAFLIPPIFFIVSLSIGIIIPLIYKEELRVGLKQLKGFVKTNKIVLAFITIFALLFAFIVLYIIIAKLFNWQ